MSKKIVVLNGSPRKKGNTSALVKAFTEGAQSAGNTVTEFFLDGMEIHGCKGCFGGHSSRECPCVQKDDMAEVLQKLIDADVIVLSSPVYYYSVCAQLKAMIDRSLPIGADGGKMRDKEFYFITTAADDPAAMERTMNDLQGYGVDQYVELLQKGYDKIYGAE